LDLLSHSLPNAIDAVTQPGITVEQLLFVIGAVCIPGISAVFYVVSKISALETKLTAIEELRTQEKNNLLFRLERIEAHNREIGNNVQALALMFARGENNDRKNNPMRDGD
jgi:hypothetical protein